MAMSDFQLTSMVRRTIVSIGIDSNLLNIGVFNGVAYIKGEVQKQDASMMKIMKDLRFSKDLLKVKIETEYKAALTALDKELKALPGIKGVVYQIRGWRKNAGGWVKESG